MNIEQDDENRPKWLIGMVSELAGDSEKIAEYVDYCCLSFNEMRWVLASINAMEGMYSTSLDEDELSEEEAQEALFQVGMMAECIRKIEMATGMGMGPDDEDESSFKPWEMN